MKLRLKSVTNTLYHHRRHVAVKEPVDRVSRNQLGFFDFSEPLTVEHSFSTIDIYADTCVGSVKNFYEGFVLIQRGPMRGRLSARFQRAKMDALTRASAPPHNGVCSRG